MSDIDKKNLNNSPDEPDESKVGGVPDSADDKGLDETMGDVVNGTEAEAAANYDGDDDDDEDNDEDEATEPVEVGGLVAREAQDGVEELTVEDVMEDSFLR